MNDRHLNEMRKDFNEFFNTMNDKYKSTFKMHTVRFSGSRAEVSEGSFKVEFVVDGQKSKDEQILELYAKSDNLDLTKKYDHHRLGTIKLHSYLTKARSNKYVIESSNGKKYRIDYVDATRYFGNKPTKTEVTTVGMDGKLTLTDRKGRVINGT